MFLMILTSKTLFENDNSHFSSISLRMTNIMNRTKYKKRSEI